VAIAAGLGATGGVRAPLDAVRRLVWGYELWAAFAVSALATGGSLYFSDIAHYVPCELCWYQRICMYPLSILTLLAALANDHRIARYLLPLPLAGGGVSTYHVLVEQGVVKETQACRISAPGGCVTRWIEELGYVTIPVLALTAFVLVACLLLLAAAGADQPLPDVEGAPPVRTEPPVAAVHGRPGGAIVLGGLAAALLAAGAIGWAIGHSQGDGDGGTATTATTTATATATTPVGSASAGRAVFVSTGCTACHAVAAVGSTSDLGPRLDGIGLDAGTIAAVVASGRGAMPSYEDRLSSEEIRDVAAFVAAQSP
jgi:disulfide bond formation protein DsbB